MEGGQFTSSAISSTFSSNDEPAWKPPQNMMTVNSESSDSNDSDSDDSDNTSDSGSVDAEMMQHITQQLNALSLKQPQ